MIVIFAEKPDVGRKLAAALDKITLGDGTQVELKNLQKYEKAVKALQSKDGYLKIRYQGQETYVTWGYGHLCALKREKDYDPTYAQWRNLPLPFFPAMELKLNDSGDSKLKAMIKSQFKKVKDLFFKADLIINATDDDREGELIFTNVYEYAKCRKPVKRIFLSSYTKGGITKSFDEAVDYSERMTVVDAGKARSFSDFIVGTNITTALTLKNPNCGLISSGRLQTTVLNMICEREKAILNFKPEAYFTITASMKTDAGEDYEGVYEGEKIKDKDEAEHIFNMVNGAKKGTVTSVETTEKEKEAPELYNLAALQMDANSLFGLTMKQTLDIAQKLYSEGYTTYPRTTSRCLNEDKKSDVEKLLDGIEKMTPEYEKLLGGMPRKVTNPKRYFDDSKVESHFAIIPTGKKPSGLSSYEEKVYDLIVRSVIKMIYPNAKIANTTMKTSINGEIFVTKGTAIVEKGWMEVGGSVGEKTIPALKEKDTVSVEDIKIEKKFTSPPNRYTDKTLVAAMISAGKTLEDKELAKILSNPKHAGIGTAATRDSIVETLIKREYIVREKKSIVPTKRGMEVIDIIPISDLKSPEMTAKWEQRLINIEDGKDTLDDFVDDVKTDVERWLKMIDETTETLSGAGSDGAEVIGNCPSCGKPVRKTNWGYGCAGYKDGCKFTIGTICNKKISAAQAKQLIENGRTGVIKGFKSKAGKSFDAALKLDEDNKVTFDFGEKTEATTIGKCPVCGSDVVKTKWGYSCKGRDNGCQFSVGKICEKTLTETQVKQLLNDGKTEVISGFTSKKGNTFDAALYVDENGAVKFEFASNGGTGGVKPSNAESVGNCPACGKPVVKNSWGYGCTGYKDGCRFSVGTICGKKISEAQVKQLISKGKTGVIKGFKSKAGKSFDAMLVLNDGSVGFEFPPKEEK